MNRSDFDRRASNVLQALDAARERRRPPAGWPFEDLAEAPAFQLVALAVYGDGEPALADLAEWLARVRPEAVATARRVVSGGQAPPPWGPLSRAVLDGSELPRQELGEMAAALTARDVDRDWLAAFVALCARRGLSAPSVAAMTLALRDSGSIVDLRGRFGSARLVRRYPTGSVSEKVALTLPPLVSLASASGVLAPVIVARSLGFAGGTWDKLARIPGFRFLDSGEIEGPLRQAGACYAVPNESIAPADRELYAFRAAIGAVDSVPLIAASIASKHLALPVDSLLLDMQVGDAGFVPDQAAAAEIEALIAEAAAPVRMAVSSYLRDAGSPTGSCIGPPVEVWEALAVMGASGPPFASLDSRLIERQRRVTARVFSLLLERAGCGDGAELEEVALGHLRSGAALEAWSALLAQHAVSPETLEALVSEPLATLGCGPAQTSLEAEASGRVAAIDYRALGLAVNVGLAAGSNPYLAAGASGAGLQLHVQPGDRVRRGDRLCTVHGSSEAGGELRACFELAPLM